MKADVGEICAPFTVEKVPVTVGWKFVGSLAATIGNVSPMVGDE